MVADNNNISCNSVHMYLEVISIESMGAYFCLDLHKILLVENQNNTEGWGEIDCHYCLPFDMRAQSFSCLVNIEERDMEAVWMAYAVWNQGTMFT